MKSVAWGACGIALGIVLILAIGILTIQVAALRGGAVLDINNTVVAVTRAHVPFLQIIAIAALSSVVLLLLTVAVRKNAKRLRIAFVVGFDIALIVLIPLSFVLAPLYGADGSLTGGPPEPGWVGWLGSGGSSPAVHVVFLLTIASFWLNPGSRQLETRSELSTSTGPQ